MLKIDAQETRWTLFRDGQVLLEHTKDRPFAVAVRREKTYAAKRGTVKVKTREIGRAHV